MRESWPRRLTTPVDALLALLFVVATVVESLANDAAPYPVVRAVLGGAAASSVALRRTHPTFAAVLLGALMAIETWTTESPDEVGVLFSAIVVAYSVGAYAPTREAFLGAMILTLSISVTIAADPSDSVSNIPPTILLFVGLPVALGVAMRRRHQDIEALTLETEALAAEAAQAVATERRRIARELHDVVSHAVTLIAVQAEAGQSVIDSDPAGARRSLESIGQVSREALDELARLLAVLDEQGPLADAGLARLPALVAGVQATGLDVELADSGAASPLSPDVDRCAYRVVQEALTNALRHTAGGRVDVRVTRSAGALDVEVRSEGRPHTSSYGGTGRGLAGLRERVQSLGGTFDTGTSDDAFVVRAVLPAGA